MRKLFSLRAGQGVSGIEPSGIENAGQSEPQVGTVGEVLARKWNSAKRIQSVEGSESTAKALWIRGSGIAPHLRKKPVCNKDFYEKRCCVTKFLIITGAPNFADGLPSPQLETNLEDPPYRPPSRAGLQATPCLARASGNCPRSLSG